MIVCETDLIASRHLPPSITSEIKDDGPDSITVPLGISLEEAEKDLIRRTLASVNNNKTKAAEILGISLKTLHNKLHRYSA